MSTLTITTIQSELYWEDKAANLSMFEKKINSIEEETEIVVLPEMFSTGFSMNPEKLAEILSSNPWRSEHRLIVLDREGSLVLTIPPSDFENVEAFSKAIFPKIEHAPSGTMDIKGPNGG